MDKKVLVLIPTYNEEDNLPKFIPLLNEFKDRFDFIFINDGSKDKSLQILRDSGVEYLSHSCNMGYSKTLQTGMKYAIEKEYQYICFIDSDGQHDPNYLVPTIEYLIQNDKDLVIGSRFIEKKRYLSSFQRSIGMIFFSYLIKLVTKTRIYDTTSGFKVMNRKVCNILKEGAFADFHAESIIYLLLRNIRITEYPISIIERESGSSMYSLFSSITYPLKTLFLIFIGIIDFYISKRKANHD